MPLDNYGIVHPGLFRSAQPDAHGCAVVNALAVSAVVKLNRDDEFPLATERSLLGAGVMILHAPDFSILRPNKARVLRLVDELVDLVQGGHRVLVHCQHGRDRTGLIVGAYELIHKGDSLDLVLENFRAYDTSPLTELVDANIRDLLREIAHEA